MSLNINEDIAQAFWAGKSRKNKNTQTDGQKVLLFNRVIVQRVHPRLLRISLGGFEATKTTVARLQAILKAKGCDTDVIMGYRRADIHSALGSATPMDPDKFYVVPVPEQEEPL